MCGLCGSETCYFNNCRSMVWSTDVTEETKNIYMYDYDFKQDRIFIKKEYVCEECIKKYNITHGLVCLYGFNIKDLNEEEQKKYFPYSCGSYNKYGTVTEEEINKIVFKKSELYDVWREEKFSEDEEEFLCLKGPFIKLVFEKAININSRT